MDDCNSFVCLLIVEYCCLHNGFPRLACDTEYVLFTNRNHQVGQKIGLNREKYKIGLYLDGYKIGQNQEEHEIGQNEDRYKVVL